jgi:hypothetical protein
MIDQTQGRRTRYGEVWRLPYLGFSEFSAQIFESDVQQPSLELFQCFYLSEREKEDAKRKMLRWTSIMGFFWPFLIVQRVHVTLDVPAT